MFNIWGEIAEHGTYVIWKKEKKISFIEWADDLPREYVLSQIRQQVSFTQADVAERVGVS